MTVDPLKSFWVAREGSIYTTGAGEMRSSFPGNKKTYHVPVAIAFNIGDVLANYIVETHNAQVLWKATGLRNNGTLSPF